MPDRRLVYVTTSSRDEAMTIARAIVGEHLAACANVLPSMTSVYHWQGKLEESEEALLLLKTREHLLPRLFTRIKELHSYEIPAMVALQIREGYEPYLDWLDGESPPSEGW